MDAETYCSNTVLEEDDFVYTRVSSGDDDDGECCRDVCKHAVNDGTAYITCSKQDFSYLDSRDAFCDETCDNDSWDTALDTSPCADECTTCNTDQTSCTENQCRYLVCFNDNTLFDRCEIQED